MTEHSIQTKLKNLFRNFSLMLLCYFLFFFLISMLQTLYPDLDLKQYEQTDLMRTLKEHPYKFIFLASIAAPVIEESLFRTLIKPSQANLKLFVSALAYLVGLMLIPEEGHWMLRYTLLFLSIYLLYYALGELIPEYTLQRITRWLHKKYVIFWLLTSAIFGFVHIFNYVENVQLDLVLFIMIFPRMIAGFFLGKLKIENRSILWPILLHSMNNSMVLIFMFRYIF
ncbi:abortive phage infection protein [Christiangramia salexigens]|uniref:Abortive phage infection protein n=2 Tax=Christiangramia salexigens TaxID=1913577 RepID=A0A1L3J271_9FLAO|nr:abortive phage infection protein [Christiangramia salexigens]